jgi:NAD(P)-dependent dehydrogenase (short-subunit alcohol dehydrogenase family)
LKIFYPQFDSPGAAFRYLSGDHAVKSFDCFFIITQKFEFQQVSGEEKRKASADRHPLRRVGTSQEIARSAAHLLSDAGSWITGQSLTVDGGMSALRTFR